MISRYAVCQNPYDLWLQYDEIEDKTLMDSYKKQFSNVYLNLHSAIGDVIKDEREK